MSMDRRGFLAALAAVGLIPKALVSPTPDLSLDDFDDSELTDDPFWTDDEPAPPPEPLPPVRSEGPDALIVDGQEIRFNSLSWSREVDSFGGHDGVAPVHFTRSLDIEFTSTDEAAEKLGRSDDEVSVAYRANGWLRECGSAYVKEWSTYQEMGGYRVHHVSLRVFRHD